MLAAREHIAAPKNQPFDRLKRRPKPETKAAIARSQLRN
jgi:hypothetical protein